MATIMEMPKLSDTMSEGSVNRWLKKEGDKVTAGTPIIEIETDKASMEYEAPSSGILLKILVGDSGKCPLNAPIAIIGKADEKWEDILEKHKSKTKQTHSSAQNPNEPSKESSPQKSTIAPLQASTTTSQTVKASPLAKKIAAEIGVDLSSIHGSGPNGRIIQRDLTGNLTNAAVKTRSNLNIQVAAVEKIPHTNMRRTIARRLTESYTTAPHFFLTLSINMTNIMQWRKETLAKLPEDQKFSVNDLIIFIVSRALKKHPIINSSWQEDCILQYSSVNMSVAVAVQNGLLTPVIRNSDQLGLIQIAHETKRLVNLAKNGKLQPDDYAGGTFSISNLGMSGIEEFTAIINPPQAAILAIGSTVPTPVVSTNGSIVVENRMKVTLSCDHRVIDGSLGAEFLKTVKLFFEDPLSAFLLN